MMKHLHENTLNVVQNSTIEERISYLKRFKWIGYTQAKTVLKALEELLAHPVVHRMPNILLVGESNNGKTALLHRLLKQNQSSVDDETGEIFIPVLIVQAPPEPDERRFYNAILDALFAPYNASEKIEMRQQRVIHLLKKVKTKVLVIDEIQHVLAGTISKQRLFLNVIKYLSNELKISLVCSGTREAFNAIQTDPQLANRFNPKVLSKWKNNESYLRLLASFERILPLKEPSYLTEQSIASKILRMSEGLIGEITKILELASIMAMESEIEKITHGILDAIDFNSPSERKKIIHQL